ARARIQAARSEPAPKRTAPRRIGAGAPHPAGLREEARAAAPARSPRRAARGSPASRQYRYRGSSRQELVDELSCRVHWMLTVVEDQQGPLGPQMGAQVSGNRID